MKIIIKDIMKIVVDEIMMINCFDNSKKINMLK